MTGDTNRQFPEGLAVTMSQPLPQAMATVPRHRHHDLYLEIGRQEAKIKELEVRIYLLEHPKHD